MLLKGYPWRQFFVLWAAWAVLMPLMIPFQFVRVAQAVHPPPMPENLLFAIAARTLVMGSVTCFFGLLLARRIGCGMPYLEQRLYGAEPARPLRSIVAPALFWAAATALLAFAIDAFFFYVLGQTTPAAEIHARLPQVEGEIWAGVLASFSAGYTEEIAMRLFLMSLCTWIVMKLIRARAGRRLDAAFWAGNILSTVPFGLLHADLVRMFGEPSQLLTLRTVLIVSGPGLAFGYLYWKRGLEAAILSHFAIDIIVHVLRPAFERLF